LVEDLAESRSGFDAAVYPSLLVARRRLKDEVVAVVDDAPAPSPADLIRVTIRSKRGTKTWRCPTHRLSIDGTPGSPWLLVPGSVRKAFKHVSRSSAPFGISKFGQP